MRVEQIGDCTLYLADCLDVLPTLGKVDAVVTDPPYGIGFKYKSHNDAGGDAYSKLISVLTPYPKIVLQYPEEMMRYMVPLWGAPDDCYIWCYNSVNERQSRIWGFWGLKPDWFEVLQPPKNPTDKRLQEKLSGVRSYDWCSDIQQVKNVSEEKTDHPCQVQTELMLRVILLSSAQTILDPFMGSGTTGVACVKLGRKFIGIEREPEYFEIACKRIQEAYAQPDFFVEPPAKQIQEELL